MSAAAPGLMASTRERSLRLGSGGRLLARVGWSWCRTTSLVESARTSSKRQPTELWRWRVASHSEGLYRRTAETNTIQRKGGNMPARATVSIADVPGSFTGHVISPDDPAYDPARTVVYGDIDKRPAVILRPADVDDVVRVVNLARDTGSELAVRC